MESQIEKFDPSKLVDGVKERIKSTFVSLIPDDMWESMIEKEIYKFTTGNIILRSETDYSKKDENGNYVVKYWEERRPYTQCDIKNTWGEKKDADISPLQKMIREELKNKFREDLKNYLNGPEYQEIRDQYGVVKIGEALEEILVKNSDTIYRKFMANIMQNAFDAMRASVSNY